MALASSSEASRCNQKRPSHQHPDQRRRQPPRGKGKGCPFKTELALLRAKREEHGITLQKVADEAAKTARFGTCGVPTVSSTLRGDSPSKNVIEALRRLIDGLYDTRK
jgi:hypothetical protein